MTAELPGRRFFIALNTDVRPGRLRLAMQKSYERLEDAVADMGEGVVFDGSGAIVAFHERHAWLLERRGGSPRMSSAPEPSLAEEGRRLASQREDLIAAGVNPSLLEVPLHPDDA